MTTNWQNDMGFRCAVDRVFRHEGGLVEDPDDPGGITNYGISLRFLQTVQPNAMADDIKNLTKDQAGQLYYQHFWKAGGYDRIGPLAVAEKILDLAVNVGGKQAGKLLQRACRSCGRDLVEDGEVGPITCRNIEAIPTETLIAALRSEAAGYYRSLVAAQPIRVKWLKGWLNRAYD